VLLLEPRGGQRVASDAFARVIDRPTRWQPRDVRIVRPAVPRVSLCS